MPKITFYKPPRDRPPKPVKPQPEPPTEPPTVETNQFTGKLVSNRAKAKSMVYLIKPAPEPPGPSGWQHVKIGAGGFVAGGDIHSDGTMVARCDTDAGAFVWNATTQQWDRMTTFDSMPAIVKGPQYANQINAIRIAPTNSNVFWLSTRGYVLKTINKGGTWARTGLDLPRDISGANAFNYQEGRLQSDRIAVSPTDENHVLVGSYHNGVWVTSNGGTTWVQGTGIPNSGFFVSGGINHLEGHGIAFINDSTVMASSRNNGYYISTDGGLTWSLSTSALTACRCIKRTSTGVLFALENLVGTGGGERVFRYDGSWTQMSAFAAIPGWRSIAVDHSVPGHVVVVGGNKAVQTSDNGANWQTAWNNNSPAASTYESGGSWLAAGLAVSSSVGEAVYHPTNGFIYVFEGIGVWKLNVPAVRAAPNHLSWIAAAQGIENLVTTDLKSPPGGFPVYTTSDRPVWTIEDVDVYRDTYYDNTLFAHGYAVDWASADPSFLCCVTNAPDISGKSFDKGVTWSRFAGAPSPFRVGGSIAASTELNMCRVFSAQFTEGVYYTLDGGATWLLEDNASFGVTPTGGGAISGWGDSPNYFRHIICADRVLANTFYVFNAHNTATNGGGLFKTTNGGVSWTRIASNIAPNSAVADPLVSTGNNARLQAIPNHAGHMVWSAGGTGSVAEFTVHPATGLKLTYCKDASGTVWQAFPNTAEPSNFGFGAGFPGFNDVTIFFNGWYAADGSTYVYGNWMCKDYLATTPVWELVGGVSYPMGHYPFCKAISGDMNEPGVCYVGFAGSSLGVYRP